MTIPEINNEELKSMMRLFENLSPRKQGYLQGYLAGSETAERNREDKKNGDTTGSSRNVRDQG